MQAPSSLPLTGNIPTVIHDNVTYHCSEDEINDICYYSHMSRLGQNTCPELICRYGVALLYVDGMYFGTASDCKYALKGYYPQTTTENVDIFYSRYENLASKSIEVPEPGKLEELLASSDTLNLFELKLSGEIDERDIATINTLRSLGILDLRDAKVSGNKIFTPFQFLQILYLPPQLTHYEGVKGNAFIADLPESLEYCGWFTCSDFIKLNSKTPPHFASNYIPNLNYTILLVPVGTKDIYLSDPQWGKAREIIECDEPLTATWNYPYLNITDSFCALSTGYEYIDCGWISYPPEPWDEDPVYPGRYFIIPSEVTHNGVTRQVKYIKDIRPVPTFTLKGETFFQGRDLYFLPEDGFLKGTSHTFYSGVYSMQYAITSRLTSNFTGIEGSFIVPPHSHIGKDDELDELNSILERYEMFSLEKDCSTNLMAFKPVLKGITITDVRVDGTSIQPIEILASGQMLYHVDLSKVSTVSVSYDFQGLHTMTTTYPIEVLSTIPDTELISGIKEVEVISNDREVDVYSLSGVRLITKANKEQLLKLCPGMYIVRQDNKIQKLVIR